VWAWITERGFKPKFYKLPTSWSLWGTSPASENSHGRIGNRTRDLMVSGRKLWPPSHEAGRFYIYLCLICWKCLAYGHKILYLQFFPLSFTSFIHLAVCLTTGVKLLPKRALHIVRSRACSFIFEYPLLSLRSSSSFLSLHARLPFTSIHPFIFPSITCRRRQFLRKIRPIRLASAWHYVILFNLSHIFP
jgi:hypothetical protein